MSSLKPDEVWLSRLLEGALPDPGGVRKWVDGLRTRAPDAPPELLARRASDRLTWLHTTQGAALSLPGALPGLGTAAMITIEAGALTAEMGILLKNQAYMTAALAEIHGFTADREAVFTDTLFTMGLWCGALQAAGTGAAHAAADVSRSFAVKQASKVSTKAVKKVAVLVGKSLASRYLIKRGAVAVGKMVPFGVGALIGGGFSFSTIRAYQRTALNYFAELVPGEAVLVETELVETDSELVEVA